MTNPSQHSNDKQDSKGSTMTSKYLNIIPKWRSQNPYKSTWLAAFALAISWVAVWLLVFSFSTVILGLSTGIITFIMFFWLSILAESYIRYMENTNFIAKFSKPLTHQALGDNRDFDSKRASLLFFMGLTGLFLASYAWYMLGGQFLVFVPRPESVLFDGLIIRERGGIVLRGSNCLFFPGGENIDFLKDIPSVSKIDPNTGAKQLISAVPCPQEYQISITEKISFSGLDDPINPGQKTLFRMLSQWRYALSSYPILFTLLFGTLLRTLIYKKSPHGSLE